MAEVRRPARHGHARRPSSPLCASPAPCAHARFSGRRPWQRRARPNARRAAASLTPAIAVCVHGMDRTMRGVGRPIAATARSRARMRRQVSIAGARFKPVEKSNADEARSVRRSKMRIRHFELNFPIDLNRPLHKMGYPVIASPMQLACDSVIDINFLIDRQ